MKNVFIKKKSFATNLLSVKSNDMNKVMTRMKKPTPKFFRQLRNVSLTLAAVSTAILSSSAALPAAAINIAGYLAVAGAVAGAVSQTAVKNDR